MERSTKADGVPLEARAEAAQYAGDVLSGRSDVAPPPSLSNMRVTYRASEKGGRRADGEPAFVLTITIGSVNVGSALLVLLSVAASAAVGYAWWLRGADAFTPWLALPTVPVVLWMLVRARMLMNRLEVTLEDGILVSQSSLWPKAAAAIPVPSIEQVSVVKDGELCAVDLQLVDSRVRLLGPCSALMAIHLECLLEAAMRLQDVPLEGEVGRTAGLPKAPRVRQAVLLELLIFLTLAGGAVIAVRLSGVPLATLTVVDDVSQANFRVDGPARVFVGADVTLGERRWAREEDIPFALDYEIAIVHADKELGRRLCDPRNGFGWFSRHDRKMLVGFDRMLRGCAFELPEAGVYSVRARRVWRQGQPRIALAETRATLLLDP